jgi:CubicO group peptidase (beta-lactamase class C family)
MNLKAVGLLGVFLGLSHLLPAQHQRFAAVLDTFQANYNSGDYDKIFESFSPEMQQNLPLKQTLTFLSGLKMQAGNFQQAKMIEFEEEGGYASFRTTFEKEVLSVVLSLNPQNEISGLLIKPYPTQLQSEPSIVNALTSYPSWIAKMVFPKTLSFPSGTQLSIAIIKEGKTEYYGTIIEDDSVKAINNQEQVFEIGSITKVFTSTVLASLVLNEEIELVGDINAYYPFGFKDNARINFRSLANHTSGLPRLPANLDLSNMDNPYKDYGREELEDYLMHHLEQKNQRGQTYEYSNLGAGLLGYTLGVSQQKSFQELLQKEIFDKYQMKNSYTKAGDMSNRLVKGQDVQGKAVPNWEFDVLFGAGGMLSTTKDLVVFAKAHFDDSNEELTLTRTPTFIIDENMEIGLGWHILEREDGESLYWHNGGTGGYSSSMILNTNNNSAVIILSNVSTFHPEKDNIDTLSFELMDGLGNTKK